MGKAFNTFLKYRYTIAGAATGLTFTLLKLSADYLLFNPEGAGPIALLADRIKTSQELFDYLILIIGPVAMMSLLGWVYGKVIHTERIAFRDPLTGAFNKRYLEETEKRLKKKKAMFTLAMVDLDNFKPINDKFGHETGDEALRRVYKIFEEEKRIQDTIIRYGGDEFLMLLPATDTKGAKKLLKRMQKKVSTIQYGNIKLGFSLGVVMEREAQHTKLQDLIRKADKRMYKDKAKKHKR